MNDKDSKDEIKIRLEKYGGECLLDFNNSSNWKVEKYKREVKLRNKVGLEIEKEVVNYFSIW